MRVATLNLWGDHPPLERRLDLAAAGLRECDLVLLQEVRVSRSLPNTAQCLAQRFGPAYRAHYACATRGEAGTWGPESESGEEGLAFVSRLQITETRALELPCARPNERRILLSAHLEGSWWCHTTHLHYRTSDGPARVRQVEAILERIDQLEGPQLLGGDFNAAPELPEMQLLADRLQDAFAHCHPGVRGETWAARNPGTAALARLGLDRRLDYLFVRGLRVTSCEIVLDQPVESLFASDHFGLVAEIDA